MADARPHRVELTRTECAVRGRQLRDHARYLWTLRPSYAWEVGADLVETADRIDPANRDESMSRKGQNIRWMLDRVRSADAEVERLKALASRQNETIAQLQAGAGDEEDAAAEAELEQLREQADGERDQPPGPAPEPNGGDLTSRI